MSRNANSHFSIAPANIDIGRSKFNRPSRHITTLNVGDIVPFYLDEVLPGDTHKVKTSKVLRMQTLLTPFMDNIYFDTYYFFVPNRILWEHWKQFMGESNAAWVPTVTYQEPQITTPSGGWSKGTIADYFGLPTGISGLPSVSALPFRAYAMICDTFFRDENLTDPLNIPVNDSTQTGTNGSSYVNDVANGGMPFKAAKFHDYFTSCLPAPQKGNSVSVSLGDMTGAVYGSGKTLALTDGTNMFGLTRSANVSALEVGTGAFGTNPTTALNGGSTGDKRLGVPTKAEMDALVGSTPDMTGLVADIAGSSLISINELRLAFQTQKYLETTARTGSRYIEILKGLFNVTAPDYTLQRPQYLGGKRIDLKVSQIVQSSETGNTPQGTTTAYSLTSDTEYDFESSFCEHGYIIGVCVARYDHTYQQGIEKLWFRKDKLDRYIPLLANIGEQPVLNKQLYAQSDSVVDSNGNIVNDKVFGYQEAWAEYRYKPSRVSGEMRSTYATSLDCWHLADEYQSLPSLSDSWIREDANTVDRVLAVSQRNSDQILADFYIVDEAVRPMPVYSIPGLIDHH